jgi:protease I
MSENKAAGEGLSDEEMAKQVSQQTSSELDQKDWFERESEGTLTDTEAAKADADELT